MMTQAVLNAQEEILSLEELGTFKTIDTFSSDVLKARMDEKVRDERILQEHDLQKIGNGICEASQEQDFGGNNSRIIRNELQEQDLSAESNLRTIRTDICKASQEQDLSVKSNLQTINNDICEKLQKQDLDRQCNLQTIRDNVYKKLQEQIDKKRKISTLPAPACGLYLSRVYY
jgi:hypothetical protein